MYKEILLSGTCYADLNTEVRFCIADSRACDIELIKLSLATDTDHKNNSRISNCLIRVMRAMMKDGLIQFFVAAGAMDGGSTEAEFLINKYGRFLSNPADEYISYYVKI